MYRRMVRVTDDGSCGSILLREGVEVDNRLCVIHTNSVLLLSLSLNLSHFVGVRSAQNVFSASRHVRLGLSRKRIQLSHATTPINVGGDDKSKEDKGTDDSSCYRTSTNFLPTRTIADSIALEVGTYITTPAQSVMNETCAKSNMLRTH